MSINLQSLLFLVLSNEKVDQTIKFLFGLVFIYLSAAFRQAAKFSMEPSMTLIIYF